MPDEAVDACFCRFIGHEGLVVLLQTLSFRLKTLATPEVALLRHDKVENRHGVLHCRLSLYSGYVGNILIDCRQQVRVTECRHDVFVAFPGSESVPCGGFYEEWPGIKGVKYRRQTVFC